MAMSFVEVVNGKLEIRDVSSDAPLPVTSTFDGAGVATDATLQNVLQELQTPVSALAPTVPEPLNGTNAVLAVKVSQTGAGTATIEALDADEAWDIVGWKLSFSAACTVTFSVDDDDSNLQFAFDIPGATVWTEPPGSFAHFTGNIGEPVSVANSAGNMKGVVYVRKHA